MSLTIKTGVLFCALTFAYSAAAQENENAGDIKEQLASVNARIDSTSKENVELKAQLAEIQNQIDELKRLSEQKEDELNMLRQKAGASESDD